MWHFGKIRGVGGVEAVLGKYECVDAQSAPPDTGLDTDSAQTVGVLCHLEH